MFFNIYPIVFIVFFFGCNNSPQELSTSLKLSQNQLTADNKTLASSTPSITDGTMIDPEGSGSRIIPPVPEVNTVRPDASQMKTVAPVVLSQSSDAKILLPIEIMSNDIQLLPQRQITFKLTKEQLSSITKMDVTFHGLSYQSKASVKFNNGEEQDINEKNTRIQLKGSVKSLGGINGGYAVVPMDITIVPGELVEGNNTITFRMINRRASATGFRVLYFNFHLNDGTDLFPETMYAESSFANDPVQWPAVSQDAAVITNGKNLWIGAGGANRRGLKSLEGKPMKASCADCHLRNAWDLKYFNYSPMSITARSMAHGLTKSEGDAIAAYVNSINVQPYGRPWNPVYQPGPGLEEKPIEQWAAGAGASWVMGKDAYTSLFLYPKAKTDIYSWKPEQLNGGIKTPDSNNFSTAPINFTLKDLAARTQVNNPVMPEQFGKNGYMNTINTPISAQMVDWNEWLPRIWPGDLDDDFIPGDKAEIRPLFRRNSPDPNKNMADIFLSGPNAAFDRAYATLAGMSYNDRIQFIKSKQTSQIHEGIAWKDLQLGTSTGGVNAYMPAHGAVIDPDTLDANGQNGQYFGSSLGGGDFSGVCNPIFKDKSRQEKINIYKASSPNRKFNISRFCNLGADDPLYPNNRTVAYKDFDDYETAIDSINKWAIVRAFEIHHVFSLLGLGQYLDPEQQKLTPNGNFNTRRWIFGGVNVFTISPHMAKLSNIIGADYIRKDAYNIRSDQWYYLQIILNPHINRRAKGKESPTDWGYMYGFLDIMREKTDYDEVRSASPSMMRFLISSQKKMQSSYPTAPRGEFFNGWTFDKMFDPWLLSEKSQNFYYFGDVDRLSKGIYGRPKVSLTEMINDSSSPEAKSFLQSLMISNYQSWFDETKNHTPKEFFTGYTDADGKEIVIGRGGGICNNKEPDAAFNIANCDANTPPVTDPAQVLIYSKEYTNPYFYRKNNAESIAGTVALAREQGFNSPLFDQMICYLSYAAPNPANIPILQSLMSDKRLPQWDLTNKKCK